MNWCPNCNDLLDSLGQEYVGECSNGSGFEKIYIEHFYCSNCGARWKCKTIDYMGELVSGYLELEIT